MRSQAVRPSPYSIMGRRLVGIGLGLTVLGSVAYGAVNYGAPTVSDVLGRITPIEYNGKWVKTALGPREVAWPLLKNCTVYAKSKKETDPRKWRDLIEDRNGVNLGDLRVGQEFEVPEECLKGLK